MQELCRWVDGDVVSVGKWRRLCRWVYGGVVSMGKWRSCVDG